MPTTFENLPSNPVQNPEPILNRIVGQDTHNNDRVISATREVDQNQVGASRSTTRPTFTPGEVIDDAGLTITPVIRAVDSACNARKRIMLCGESGASLPACTLSVS